MHLRRCRELVAERYPEAMWAEDADGNGHTCVVGNTLLRVARTGRLSVQGQLGGEAAQFVFGVYRTLMGVAHPQQQQQQQQHDVSATLEAIAQGVRRLEDALTALRLEVRQQQQQQQQ